MLLVVNLVGGNIGDMLMSRIRSKATELDATSVTITAGKKNKYALIDLYEGNDCIALNYEIIV